MKITQKHVPVIDFSDLGAPQAIENFLKAALAFTKEATRSEASAKKVLVEEGIYTEAGEAAAAIARSFNRRPPAVASAVRSIERVLVEEPILGEQLNEVERELGPANRQATEAQSPSHPSSRPRDDF